MITFDTTITHPFSHDVVLGGLCVAQMEGTLHIGRNPIDPETWIITAAEVNGARRNAAGTGWDFSSVRIDGGNAQHKALFLEICAGYEADGSPYRDEIDAKWAEADAERIDEARQMMPLAA